MLRQIKLHTIQPHLCEWLKWQKLQGQKRTKDCWGPGAERSGRQKDKGAHSWWWGQARGLQKCLSLYCMYRGGYGTVHVFLNSPSCTFKMCGFYKKIRP